MNDVSLLVEADVKLLSSIKDKLFRLTEPFDDDEILSFKGKGNFLQYFAKKETYQNRLDEVFPFQWSSELERMPSDEMYCVVTIHPIGIEHPIVRGSTAEEDDDGYEVMGKEEARAFKRACSYHGVGRFLYPLGGGVGHPNFPPDRTSVNLVSDLDKLGISHYGEVEWGSVERKRLTMAASGDRKVKSPFLLTKQEIMRLITGLGEINGKDK